MRSQRKWLFGILLVLASFLVGIACPRALRGGNVTPTNTWVDLYSTASTYLGGPVPVGAYIAVYDPQGVQCGEFTVTYTGMYGVMPCYGDDPLTPQDEGAVLGDVLHFTINGQAAQTEAISVNGAPVVPNTVVIWSPVQSLWQVNLHVVTEGSTATPTPTATETPASSVTPTPTPSATASATETPTTTASATLTATATGTPTASPTSTVTSTATPTQTLTATPTTTSSPSPTATPSATASPTGTGMAPPSPTPTSSATVTPTSTPTLTVTATMIPTATQTSRGLWLPLVLRRS